MKALATVQDIEDIRQLGTFICELFTSLYSFVPCTSDFFSHLFCIPLKVKLPKPVLIMLPGRVCTMLMSYACHITYC